MIATVACLIWIAAEIAYILANPQQRQLLITHAHVAGCLRMIQIEIAERAQSERK